MAMNLVYLWGFSLLMGSCWSSLLIQSEKENMTVNIYRWSEEDKFKNQSFPLVFSNEGDQFNLTEPSCLVLTPKSASEPSDTLKVINSLDRGYLLCVLVPSLEQPNSRWVWRLSDFVDFSVPVGIIDLPPNSFQTYQNMSSTPILGIFQDWNPFLFITFIPLSIAVQVFLLIITVMCMLWAISKLYTMYHVGLFTLNIGTVCLIMEVFCLIFRILMRCTTIPWLVKPQPYPYILIVVFDYLAYPFNLSSALFLIFFWIDITDVRSVYYGGFLDRALWPCIIFVILVFILVYIPAFGLLAGARFSSSLINISNGCVFFFTLIVAIIYFFTVKRIYGYIKERVTDKTRVKELKKMSVKIILSGVTIVLFVLVSLLLILSTVFLEWAILLWLNQLLFLVRSFLQIDVFGTPKHSKNTTETETSSDLALHNTASK